MEEKPTNFTGYNGTSSPRNYVMVSRSGIAQCSVSREISPTPVFLSKRHGSLCSFFTLLKKMRCLILSVLKYIMTSREGNKKRTILFSFDMTLLGRKSLPIH